MTRTRKILRIVFPSLAFIYATLAGNRLRPATDGTVNAMVQVGDTVYVGGKFSRVGYQTGTGYLVNATNSAISYPFPFVDGPIRCAISDESGGWYIGGDFKHVDGIERALLAHVNSSGTLDTAFNAGISPTSLQTGYICEGRSNSAAGGGLKVRHPWVG